MDRHNRKEPEVKWYVAKSARLSLPYRDELDRSGLEYFLPTRFVLQNIGGKRMRVERPVIFNFIFIRGTVFQVKEFCRSQQGIYMVYRHQSKDDMPADDSNRLLTVGDREMQMFAQTVGEYVSDVPFIRPSEVDLSKGDHVRIMDGPFAGVEGILLSQQGKDGGRVLVSISNIISVPTLEIRPEFLQVISFAKSGRHLYKKVRLVRREGTACTAQLPHYGLAAQGHCRADNVRQTLLDIADPHPQCTRKAACQPARVLHMPRYEAGEAGCCQLY